MIKSNPIGTSSNRYYSSLIFLTHLFYKNKDSGTGTDINDRTSVNDTLLSHLIVNYADFVLFIRTKDHGRNRQADTVIEMQIKYGCACLNRENVNAADTTIWSPF